MKRRTWDLTIVCAAVCSAFIATPADALTPLQKHPLSAKYRDTGAKPASGRSGSAGIEARALKGANGATDIEVTTGHFEGAGAAGTLAKVQVKLLAPDGAVLATDNYRKTLTGNGYASFTYDALPHGMATQVQASVTGIDANRTDIVTVSTQVKLRPDIQAARVVAPDTAIVNKPILVSGSMSELNRDVGARATCRLLVDGTEVAAIPGAWVDAGSSVACHFHTSFASVGTHELKLRVTDIAPSDYDTSNNEIARSIEVLPAAEPLVRMSGSVSRFDLVTLEHDEFTWTRPDGTVSRDVYDFDQRQHTQSYSVFGTFPANSDLSGARITWRSSTSNGNVLPTISVAVADLTSSYAGCPYGYFGGDERYAADYFRVCTGSGYTDIDAGHNSGEVIYAIDRVTYSGPDAYFWLGIDAWDNPPYQSSLPALAVLGDTYTGDLRFEAGGVAHQGVIEVPTAQFNHTYLHTRDDFNPPACEADAGPWGAYALCYRWSYYYNHTFGYVEQSF